MTLKWSKVGEGENIFEKIILKIWPFNIWDYFVWEKFVAPINAYFVVL